MNSGYNENETMKAANVDYKKYSELDEPMKVRSAYAMMDEAGMDKITIVSAFDDLTIQADKLNALVLELLRRIEPIRSADQYQQTDIDETVVARVQLAFGSPLAERVHQIASSLRRTQSYISQAMDDIDL